MFSIGYAGNTRHRAGGKNLTGHNREASSLLTSPSGFHSGLERKNICLERYPFNHPRNFRDLVRATVDILDSSNHGLNDIAIPHDSDGGRNRSRLRIPMTPPQSNSSATSDITTSHDGDRERSERGCLGRQALVIEHYTTPRLCERIDQFRDDSE